MSAAERTDFVARLGVDWPQGAPDWVQALAQACNRMGQRRAAEALRYSASLVSSVLRGRYGADTGKVEAAVRGAFMAVTVACPVLGTLPANACIEHQRRPMSVATGNHFYARLYRACRVCPQARGDGGSDAQ